MSFQQNCHCIIIACEWFLISSESKRCIAILEASVCVLLQCLETVDSKSKTRNGYFSWEVEEGVKCAYCLRRIYEEVGVVFNNNSA